MALVDCTVYPTAAPDSSRSLDHKPLPAAPVLLHFCALPPYPASTASRIPGKTKTDVSLPCHVRQHGCGETITREFYLNGMTSPSAVGNGEDGTVGNHLILAPPRYGTSGRKAESPQTAP